MRLATLCAVLLSLALLTTPAASRTWHILPDGSGDAPTIKAGIDSASAGDTVLVGCGVYHEHDIALKSGISLLSATGEPSCVTVSSDVLGRVLYFCRVESTTVVQGLTLRWGFASTGGGALCDSMSCPRIVNCDFVENSAQDHGGGLVCFTSSSPIVEGCRFSYNSVLGPYGGAVACWESSPSFRDCIFLSNTAEHGAGGAVFSAHGPSPNGGTPTFVGCVFYGNSPTNGGVLATHRPNSPRFANCTMWGNGAYGYGGAIYNQYTCSVTLENTIITGSTSGGSVYCDGPPVVISLSCCDVYGNAGGDWVGCIADQYGINGNFSADPFFCDPDSGDFTLDAVSPCLDAPGCGLVGAYGLGCDVVTGVASGVSQITGRFFLSENVPNPFNPTTTIGFSIPAAGPVTLTVHDITGRLVATLVDGVRQPGEFTAVWNGKDDAGAQVPSGIYFARLHAGEYGAARKMVLIK